jgi:hypothetical protein
LPTADGEWVICILIAGKALRTAVHISTGLLLILAGERRGAYEASSENEEPIDLPPDQSSN